MRTLFLLLFIPICTICAQTDSIGIYIKNGNTMIPIKAIKYSGVKTNTLGTALTMGIASSNMSVTFNGRSSHNIASPSSSFYFYFSRNLGENINLITNYYMFMTSHSPDDFSLVKLNVKKNRRVLKTGKVNVYSGVDIGVHQDDIIPFNITKLGDTIYKVDIPQTEEGEYCFIHNTSGAYSSVFDFSVKSSEMVSN